MSKLDDITLTNQSFQDAGGSGAFPNLEMGGLVNITTHFLYCRGIDFNKNVHTTDYLDKALDNLKKIAARQGYTHVFNVQYAHYTAYSDHEKTSEFMITGTGYSPKAVPTTS